MPIRDLLFVLTMIVMRVVSEPTANASFLLLAGYALLGRSQAIKALALSWLFSMLNPTLVAATTFASTGRFLIIGAAALSVLSRSGLLGKNRQISLMTFATLILGLLLVVHSLVVSPFADVSILKAISWTLVTTTLLAAWGALNVNERAVLTNQMFNGLILVLICSLPLLALPQGYSRNETGFQGVLGHPQAFGPTMALLGVWAAAGMLGDRRPPWWRVLLTGACLLLIVLSEARTAGVGMVLGFAMAVVLVPILSRQRIRVMFHGLRSPRLYIVLTGAVIGGLLSGVALTDRIGSYIDKRGGGGSVLDAYQTSRGALLNTMVDNIEANPWKGIGFGIASNPSEMIIERESVFGLPSGAPIEKGVLPYQVAEEVGLLGVVFVLLWLGMAIKRASRVSVTSLAMALTVLMLNMGESTFFSPGGMGLMPLILFTWAVSVSPTNRQG
ncbi:O-antigen ligase [Limnohabitans sp. 2KL-3]|uniref:O-antigen ligase family protein n=1 Tax=Limnohabitans sp. 2KL-3 TaxID=1100700 RepID=UPI000AD93246|nr:hypothetical protein [Limnohabitans sp. 2KL-3]